MIDSSAPPQYSEYELGQLIGDDKLSYKNRTVGTKPDITLDTTG